MSMQYPVLDNRPINKWKVAELKEELKRRKLTTKGLKDDLVKRLDEAIRIERGPFEEEASRGIGSEPKHVVAHVDPLSNPSYVQMADDTRSHDINKTAKVDEVVAGIGIDGLGQGKVQVQETISGADSFEMIVGKPDLEASIETGADDTLNHDISRTAKIDKVVAAVDIDDGPAEIDQGKVLEEEAIGGNNLGEIIVGEPILEVSMQTGADDTSKTAVGDEVVAGLDPDEGPHEMDQGKVQEDEAIGGTDSVERIVEEPVLRACMETRIRDDDIAAQIASSDKASGNNKTDQENKNLNFSLTDAPAVEEPVALEASMKTNPFFNDTVVSQTALNEEPLQNNEIKTENDDSKPSQMDVECDASYPNNQVYDVSPNVGFQVKSESISTDAVYVYENTELKDNLNADNVYLELDVTKVEMVQPTSSEGHQNDCNLHSLDDNKPEGDQSFVEETDDNKSTPVDFRKENDGVVGSSVMLKLDHNLVDNSMRDVMENKPSDSNHNFNIAMDKIELMEMPVANEGTLDGVVGPQLSPDKMKTYATETAAFEGKRLRVDDNKSTSLDRIERTVADEGPMEKINLDHSSADDSMEEDVLETKQIDSNDISTEVAEKIELADVAGMKVAGTIDAVELDSDKLESSSEQKNAIATTSEKRKFQDEAAAGNKEPPKRLRRWNSGSLKISETQGSNLSLSTVPKDLFQANMLKHNLTKSDPTISADAPKERVVPPSPKPPTNSLRIDHFLRPFTLKAVQELLARTGNVCSFWMDHIKTHCYVTYSSPEEAIETRNALYNLQWPPNGGRLLVAEFVDPQEVKLRAEAPPNSTATKPVSTSPTVSATRAPIQPPSSTHQHGHKQPVSPQPPVSKPPHVSDLPTIKPLPQPPVPEKVDHPILTLDDLFRKTRATPRIYYLPLTEEQVTAKLANQNKNRQ
ncbi:uncharacterized protein LOC132274227 isoform X2 [Cornus florida]|uniref:uncharacterized protein LOC132274227 isoform X2 n=1 Tax=Cornus florida TaxID=4283 RepID=UPI002899628B|nr:uncharacterized protein LOC132274227 isoform X2 [Cornus florida]